jgi:alkyl hydroperoxide reductase subunit F
MLDLVIIGGGPAGVAAGVYAARKYLKTAFVTESFGGQSVESVGIENWIGTVSISGPDLAKSFEKHLRTYEGERLEIRTNIRAEKVLKTKECFEVILSDGKKIASKTVLVATGSSRRKLNVPGAAEFENRGITYCASCDGPLFAGKDVAVIGGGNAGFETAAQLLAYAKSVTLLHKHSAFKADPVTVEKVSAHPNMRVITDAETKEIKGGAFIEKLSYTHTKTGKTEEIAVGGVFVEIGNVPATALVEGLVELDEFKRIVVDHQTQAASLPGIWAAGDCTNTLYHQNNIAAGDGVRALEDIYLWLRAK